MLNNLINHHDLFAPVIILRRGRKEFSKAASRLFRSRTGRVQAAWAHTQNPPRNWWDIPAVRERWNRCISGDSRVDYQEYIARKYLAGRVALSALALGCGSGQRELRWAELASFSRIAAYDLSEARIRQANETAREKGRSGMVTYHVGDVYRIEMHENRYDVVFGEQALHHFSPLEELMRRINGCLRPGGYFIVNDFVGPSRFQFPSRQIEVVNALLAIFPRRYRVLWNGASLKPKLFRPSRLRMILRDPSEAVESSNILPLLRNMFEVVEIKEYGGNILQLLLSGIGHHFLDGSEESQRLLQICFDVEDALLARGEFKSDFIVAVCRKRTG